MFIIYPSVSDSKYSDQSSVTFRKPLNVFFGEAVTLCKANFLSTCIFPVRYPPQTRWIKHFCSTETHRASQGLVYELIKYCFIVILHKLLWQIFWLIRRACILIWLMTTIIFPPCSLKSKCGIQITVRLSWQLCFRPLQTVAPAVSGPGGIPHGVIQQTGQQLFRGILLRLTTHKWGNSQFTIFTRSGSYTFSSSLNLKRAWARCVSLD